ncbi:MAG: hypothetical protein ABI602_02600 [Candidatus Saccharibacteria bacterium]
MAMAFKKLVKSAVYSICAMAILATMITIAASSSASAESPGSNSATAQPLAGTSVAQRLTERAKTSWPWYVARGSGMIAAVALAILLLSGIGQVTGYTFKLLDPITAWATHRALGLAFGLAVIVHLVSLLFDHFVPFTIWQLLIPWLSPYKSLTIGGVQLGSVYVALGVIAFYLVAIVIITSLLWVEKKPYLWKLLHLLSYVILLFVFIHALYLGTDLADGILRLLWLVLAAGIAGACLHRLWRAKTL